ncbi:hypothetical protein N9544_06435 [Flavobacteriales bacterium]|nr:hypothetical protein [Flavobacteriales bacterium]
MKKIILSLSFLLASILSFSQTSPSLIIDGKAIKFESDISLPYWLDAGKTVSLGANAASVSILEFTIDSNNLVYNKTIHLTSNSSVPNGKTWKIEAIGTGVNLDFPGNVNFSNDSKPDVFVSPRVFQKSGYWQVPKGVTSICVEIWGRGGNGAFSRVGGGGAGYGYECFNVLEGDSIELIFTSDTIFFDTLIYATRGSDGVSNTPGIGGVSNAAYSENGGVGKYGLGNDGGAGGDAGGMGGKGAEAKIYNGTWKQIGGTGDIPGGGGGSGTSGTNQTQGPGLGADGQIKIYF